MFEDRNTKKEQGFTLIELLIVIAIIAIIAGALFVALDPLTRFRDARDSRRWSDLSALMTAVMVDQVDNRGSYLTAIASTTAGEVYMIGTATSGCSDANTYCDTNVASSVACVDLTGFVTENYLGAVPISPDGDGSWSAAITGYTLERDSGGIITLRSCESENSSEIYMVR